MMLAQHTSTPWAALPNLRAVSLSEGLRLVMIVGSLSFVIVAGQLAHSRGQELSDAAANQIVSAAHAEAARPVVRVQHRATPSERYARTQLKTFSELLDGLTERAETLIAVTPAEATQLKTSLQAMDEDLMAAREALTALQKSNAAVSSKEALFLEEDLRSSLITLKDSASRAQGQIISLDQSAGRTQGFKVSRIGQ